MSLELRRKLDGTLRPTFYGRYIDKTGKLKVINLGVEIEGIPPESLHGSGNAAFEISRKKAIAQLAEYEREGRSSRHARYWAEKVYELKSGGELTSTPLTDFSEAGWAAMSHRKHRPSEDYRDYVKSMLGRFAAFITSKYPTVKEVAAVRAVHVRAYMNAEEKRHVSVRTWGEMLGVLKSAFRSLEPTGDAYTNYLMNAGGREKETVHREPFTPAEIKDVLDAAQPDDLMRGMIVTALCTAMRRGDCALLKWANVDLPGGFITVKTSKTGETTEIPILPALRSELISKPRGEDEHVFPEAAAMYRKNPDGLNWRLQAVLEKAGFVDDDTAERIKKAKDEPDIDTKPTLPVVPIGEVRRRGLEWIAAANVTAGKRERMRIVFDAYTMGRNMPQISEESGLAMGTISDLVRAVETAIGAAVVRRSARAVLPTTFRGVTQAPAGGGPRMRRANVKGWHSFRTTFITLALSAGMPMELVRRVTGHTTVDVVLKHYFRPGREQLRKAVQAAMPKMLTDGAKSRDERLREIIEKMNPKKMRDQALALLAGGE